MEILHSKNLSEPKYQFLIEKNAEMTEMAYLNDQKSFKSMDDAYENIDDYNPTRNRKISIVFDNKISDIVANKKFEFL